MSEALLRDAQRFQEAGNLMEAARIYSDIIRMNPQNVEALYRLGLIHFQNRRFADAERLFAASIRGNPQVPEIFYARGCALQNLDRHEDALKAFAQALALRPDYVEVRNNRGVSLLNLKRYQEALSSFDKVLAARPGVALVESNRAAALSGLGRHQEALEASERATAANPAVAVSWYNKGAALMGLGRFEAAQIAFDQALALQPDYVDALTYRGVALAMLDRHEEAVGVENAALRHKPGDIDLLYNRATSLFALKRYEDAVADFERVLAADEGYKYVCGCVIHCRLQIADWRDLDEQRSTVLNALRAGSRVLRPLQTALISDDEGDQLTCSRIWIENDCPATTPVWRGERYEHDRIRVAYVSADFRRHPVAIQMAGAFEHHDKTRFEVMAISLKREQGAIQDRLGSAFERFIDVQGRSIEDVASLMRENEVDIAVDLMGQTEGSRTGIFAARPAPVQVAHLGFPGTSGAPYIDYILVDRIIVPPEQSTHYSEKLVHLPHSYMPCDNTREIDAHPSRAEAGLPETGLVFCSFNNVAKIIPPVFDAWMRLLNAIEGSVLWLSPAGATAVRNLRREAEARGVGAERLVFAQFVSDPSQHLARLSLADLFLDTLPYNAHAGGADALWAGVPIVTCKGSAFPGRVGASLLTAIGLPELITSSLDDYEAFALRLARDPAALSAIKAKLAVNRAKRPLFDTARFTRNLEKAYAAMWERQQRGEPPEAITIDDGGPP